MMSKYLSGITYASFSLSLMVAIIITGCGNDAHKVKVRINVSRPNSFVRNELLKRTPLGTSADTVIDFVLAELYYEGLYSSTVGIIPEPALAARVGHRYDNPPWGHSALEAYWMFDNE